MSQISSLPVVVALRQLRLSRVKEESKSTAGVEESSAIPHAETKRKKVYLPVVDAYRQLRMLSTDDEARRLADVRALSIMTERTEIEAAYAEGFAQGKAKAEARALALWSGQAEIEAAEAEAMAEALVRVIESGIPEAQARAILRI